MATVTYEETHRPGERAKGKPSRRRVAIWFVVVALLLGLVGGGLFAFDRFRSKAIADFFASQVPPPTPVAALAANVGPMPRYLDGIGTLAAVREVHVAPEVAGRVDRHRLHRRHVGRGRRTAGPAQRRARAGRSGQLPGERAAGDRQPRAHAPVGAPRFRHPGERRPEPAGAGGGAGRHRPQPGDHRPEADQGAVRRRARACAGSSSASMSGPATCW